MFISEITNQEFIFERYSMLKINYFFVLIMFLNLSIIAQSQGLTVDFKPAEQRRLAALFKEMREAEKGSTRAPQSNLDISQLRHGLIKYSAEEIKAGANAAYNSLNIPADERVGVGAGAGSGSVSGKVPVLGIGSGSGSGSGSGAGSGAGAQNALAMDKDNMADMDLSGDSEKTGDSDGEATPKVKKEKMPKNYICSCGKGFTTQKRLTNHGKEHLIGRAKKLVDDNSLDAIIDELKKAESDFDLLSYALAFANKAKRDEIIKLLSNQVQIKNDELFLCTHEKCNAYFTTKNKLDAHLKKPHNEGALKSNGAGYYKRKLKLGQGAGAKIENSKKRKEAPEDMGNSETPHKKIKLGLVADALEKKNFQDLDNILYRSIDKIEIGKVLSQIDENHLTKYIKERFNSFPLIQLQLMLQAGLPPKAYLMTLCCQNNAPEKLDILLDYFLNTQNSLDEKINSLEMFASFSQGEFLKVIQKKIAALKSSVAPMQD